MTEITETSLQSNSSPHHHLNFQAVAFNGTGKDYFGIWISNLFLSIVTLGVYSAWAKVRRMKFFYNNTSIDGYAFNYHATGMQLFKGRMIAFAILLAYSVISTLVPVVSVFFSVAFIVLMPWVLNRSLRFSARMTSWRNVRLNWHGTYGRTLWLFVLAPILSMLSLGLLIPWVTRSYYTYYAEGHSFGIERFKTQSSLSQYYKAFLTALVIPAIAAVVLWFILTSFVAPYMAQYAVHYDTQYGMYGDTFSRLQMLPICIGFFFLFTQTVYSAICRNILLRSMSLGDVARFDSNLNPYAWLWIETSNLIAILFSLGLLMPWAMVRRYKYLADHTGIGLAGSAHTFVDEQTAATGAFGEEFADIEGLEVGLLS